jgi:hypothetical protein
MREAISMQVGRQSACNHLVEHTEPRLMREAISMQVGRQSACNHLVEHTEPRLMREAIVGPQSSSEAHQSIIRPPRHLVRATRSRAFSTATSDEGGNQHAITCSTATSLAVRAASASCNAAACPQSTTASE